QVCRRRRSTGKRKLRAWKLLYSQTIVNASRVGWPMTLLLTPSSLSGARRIVAIVGLALVYLGAAWLGLRHAVVAKQVTLVWPPSGIALAAILLLGRSMWPGILLGAFAASLTSGTPALPALAVALGATLWALLAAFLLERAGFRVSLTRLRDA